MCWPLRIVLVLSTSPLRLRISSPRHQRGRTEPNLALYGHVWCWVAGVGPGGPYATITPPPHPRLGTGWLEGEGCQGTAGLDSVLGM